MIVAKITTDTVGASIDVVREPVNRLRILNDHGHAVDRTLA